MNPKLSILSQPSSFRQLLCALFLLLIEDASQIVFFRSSFPYFSLVPPLIWNWKKSSCCLYAPKRGTCFGYYLSSKYHTKIISIHADWTNMCTYIPYVVHMKIGLIFWCVTAGCCHCIPGMFMKKVWLPLIFGRKKVWTHGWVGVASCLFFFCGKLLAMTNQRPSAMRCLTDLHPKRIN